MSDELVKRLRIGWHNDDTPIWVSDAMTEAADRIEALTAERDRLRLYARHDDDCTVNRYPSAGACSCGLRVTHD